MKCIYCKGKKESLKKILCDRCDKNIPSEHKIEMQKKYLNDKDRLKEYMKDKYSKGCKE